MREGGASFIGYVGLKGRRSRLCGEALRVREWLVSAPGDSLPPFFCVLLHRSLLSLNAPHLRPSHFFFFHNRFKFCISQDSNEDFINFVYYIRIQ